MRQTVPMRRVVVCALVVVCAASCAGGSGHGGPAPSNAAAPTQPGGETVAGATGSPSAGCGTPADTPEVGSDAPGDVVRTITVDGTERSYRLGVPAGYDPDRPTPLVMNLHGSGSNALEASLYGDVPRAASARGMLTVAPEAVDGRWQLLGHGTDDDFLTALTDDMKRRYCVDTDRVFMLGISLGAWKAAVTACGAGSTFAAAALVAVEVHPPGCPPLAVVAFHGTADPTVPYGEGSGHDYPDSPNAGLPGTHENIANWAKGNGCDPHPTVERIGDDVEKWTYENCTAGLELYTVDEGGHTWPGASIDIGPTTTTIDATQIALDWFAAHPRHD